MTVMLRAELLDELAEWLAERGHDFDDLHDLMEGL